MPKRPDQHCWSSLIVTLGVEVWVLVTPMPTTKLFDHEESADSSLVLAGRICLSMRLIG